jgi:hypothetical protein
MRKIFESVNMKKPPKSGFDLSHEHKTSCQFGKLYPVLTEEVIPGDEYSVRTETLVRMAPMIAPIMERVDVYMHYFFVPNRIIWDGWEEFITGGDKGENNSTIPIFNMDQPNRLRKGTLADHLGLPTYDSATDTPATNPISVSQLPFRAYHTIWNEYYRDQNLQDPIDVEAVPVPQTFLLQTRAWGKDYFTSALPYPQKGAAVSLPVESSFTPQYKDQSTVHGNVTNTNNQINITSIGLNQSSSEGDLVTANIEPVRIENLEDNQTVDATSVTIEELRRSSRLQEWLETAARGGSRMNEMIKNFFGVNSGDARLSRPEYLGGGKTPITISEVLNNTGTDTAPQGELAGHGIAVGNRNRFRYNVKEHGYIFGIMSIMPQASYSQGVPRHWTRTDKFDFYWPQFANIGEQEVRNDELYHDFNGNGNNDDEAFGYQQRYAEYKYRNNIVTGDFRDSLDFWTLARKFGNLPTLNSEFIECADDELNNIFAVVSDDVDKFYCQIYHNIKARRPMPYFSNPEL